MSKPFFQTLKRHLSIRAQIAQEIKTTSEYQGGGVSAAVRADAGMSWGQKEVTTTGNSL